MTTYNATSSSEYQKLILELLSLEDREFKMEELYHHIEKTYLLTEDDLAMKKDGSEPVWKNMVRRSVATLKEKELIVSPKRGIFKLTYLGREVYNNKNDIIKIKRKNKTKIKPKNKKIKNKLTILDLNVGDKVSYSKSWYNEGIIIEVNNKEKYVKILFDQKHERIFCNTQNLKKII